jgi:hypothetical protein
MNNLAVLLYSASTNPQNVPGAWPKEIQDIGSSTQLPSNSWILMTQDEYNSYIATHKPSYDAWYINFMASLPVNRQQPQEVSVVQTIEAMPFATPSYRTKRNATTSTVTIAPNGNQDVQFHLTSERYVSGGDLIIENAEFGDYITAEVEDIDGLIPVPYRAATCEAWPVISSYIEKEFVKINVAGSVQAGAVTIHSIDTYPLNAKITAGLYLCIHYYAVNKGLDRKIAVNYHLTKKL